MKNEAFLGRAVLAVAAIGFGLYLAYGTPAAAPGAPAATTGNGAPRAVTFYCGAGNTMQAVFATSSVALALSDGRQYALPQARSASGIRYEATSTGPDIRFSGKGDFGALTDSASTTDTRYANCTAAHVSASGTPGYDTYENSGRTFSFTFPTSFDVVGIDPDYGPGWSAPATTTGEVLAKIAVPQSFEPGTNFGDAWFTVGTSADPRAVADCTKSLSGTEAASAPVTIGEVTYAKLEFTGVGAGNIYDTTSYRTVKDGQCYAIEYTIHYANILNYPAGKVRRFDEQKAATALDEVARSFRFLR